MNNRPEKYDLKVREVDDYTRFIGAPSTHPSVSVIHYDEIAPIRHSLVLWGVYGLFLLDDTDEKLGYGSGGYDYQSGSLVCVAPGQIGGAPEDGSTFSRRGWAVIFHPRYFHGSSFEKELNRYEFFHYHVNEAITMSKSERGQFTNVVSILRDAIKSSLSEEVIRKSLELLLAFCQSFYARHFNLPDKKSSHIVTRFNDVLNEYYANSEQLSKGQPTVRKCAARLCMASNYLGDLIKEETGESAIRFISKFIVRKAKSMLMEGKSISSAAYSLGFNYPAHLTRLFNRIEGMTPSQFLRHI